MNHGALANLRRPTTTPAHVGDGGYFSISPYLIPAVTGSVGALCYLKGHTRTAIGLGVATFLSGAWAYDVS